VSEQEILYRIQELDTRILELRDRDEKHPLRKEIEALEGELEVSGDESREKEASLEESHKKQRVKEDEVQVLEEKLVREEDKLYGGRVNNPKELRGLQAEVRSLRKKKDALETELLEEMENQDEIKEKVDELQAHRDRLQAEVDEKRKILDSEVAEIGSQLAELEKERHELRSQINEDLLEIYDTLLESRHGLAVVKVSDGVCLGCRVELPGIEFDRFLKTEDVFTCTNCGRILVK